TARVKEQIRHVAQSFPCGDVFYGQTDKFSPSLHYRFGPSRSYHATGGRLIGLLDDLQLMDKLCHFEVSFDDPAADHDVIVVPNDRLSRRDRPLRFVEVGDYPTVAGRFDRRRSRVDAI